jgi:hypothetical protein
MPRDSTTKQKLERPYRMKRICIVAFSDFEGLSLAYKKFSDVDKAVEFYRKQLENENVNVISTRKTTVKE